LGEGEIMNKAHRTLLVAMAVLALLALGAVAAFAGAPTFKTVTATITSSTTTSATAATSAADASLATSATTDVLLVSFKEIRVGQNTGIHYTVAADASATYACINRGSKNPKASNKLTVAGPVGAEGTFDSDANGNVKGSIEVTPPSPGDFTCPTGQQLVLAKLTFTNIQLTDTTNGVYAALIPGPVTKTYFNL
jgi:hypothetical protein